MNRRIFNGLLAGGACQQVQQEGLTINNDKNRYLEYWSPRYNLEQRNLVKVNLKRLLQFVDPEERKERARAFGLRWPLELLPPAAFYSLTPPFSEMPGAF